MNDLCFTTLARWDAARREKQAAEHRLEIARTVDDARAVDDLRIEVTALRAQATRLLTHAADILRTPHYGSKSHRIADALLAWQSADSTAQWAADKLSGAWEAVERNAAKSFPDSDVIRTFSRVRLIADRRFALVIDAVRAEIAARTDRRSELLDCSTRPASRVRRRLHEHPARWRCVRR